MTSFLSWGFFLIELHLIPIWLTFIFVHLTSTKMLDVGHSPSLSPPMVSSTPVQPLVLSIGEQSNHWCHCNPYMDLNIKNKIGMHASYMVKE